MQNVCGKLILLLGFFITARAGPHCIAFSSTVKQNGNSAVQWQWADHAPRENNLSGGKLKLNEIKLKYRRIHDEDASNIAECVHPPPLSPGPAKRLVVSSRGHLLSEPEDYAGHGACMPPCHARYIHDWEALPARARTCSAARKLASN